MSRLAPPLSLIRPGMLRIRDTLGGDPIEFNYCQTAEDCLEMRDFAFSSKALGMDTESTGVNCYRPGWQLRTFQIGNADTAYVVPAQWKRHIDWIIRLPNTKWIGHNGPHDIRSIDTWLGGPTGVSCAGETYIPAHHHDSRKQDDGGVGHGLKEQAIRHVARDAGKWEQALKKSFKEIRIPLPGQFYKSGKRKGEPKSRAAHISEGWALIPLSHPAYIAYAAADPILTYRLWKRYQSVVRAQHELYLFDKRIQEACDVLQRRAIRLDVRYTRRLSAALQRRADRYIAEAAELGCGNINSGKQVADALIMLGAELTERTPTGQFVTADTVLRALTGNAEVQQLTHAILGAKQMLKRRSAYCESMLAEADEAGRVHPSINSLAARTTRMSVSDPPLQQLPTKDRESDE